MAREGYTEAKQGLEDAERMLQSAHKWLDGIDYDDSLPDVVKDLHRSDARAAIARAEAELASATEAFKPFEGKTGSPVGRIDRQKFDTHINVCVSMSIDMLAAFNERMRVEGIKAAELVRRALSAYLDKPAKV